jgi:predicted enzyme related to lactoylglutathione lyase
MSVHYLEIVSNDVDALTALYQRMHGLTFGPPDPDLGQARVATRADGTLVGIRKPLATHEQPIMRTYLAVDDIQQGVKNAENAGAVRRCVPRLVEVEGMALERANITPKSIGVVPRRQR